MSSTLTRSQAPVHTYGYPETEQQQPYSNHQFSSYSAESRSIADDADSYAVSDTVSIPSQTPLDYFSWVAHRGSLWSGMQLCSIRTWVFPIWRNWWSLWIWPYAKEHLCIPPASLSQTDSPTFSICSSLFMARLAERSTCKRLSSWAEWIY